MPASPKHLSKNWAVFWALFCTTAQFKRSRWRLSGKLRWIQAGSLRQFSSRELCQRKVYSVLLGDGLTKLPRSELVLDLWKCLAFAGTYCARQKVFCASLIIHKLTKDCTGGLAVSRCVKPRARKVGQEGEGLVGSDIWDSAAPGKWKFVCVCAIRLTIDR